MMKKAAAAYIALLLAGSVAAPARADESAPINAAYTFEFGLWDGGAFLASKTVTCSIWKDDNTYWTGSAWSGTYQTVNMQERSGNANLAGRYYYTLSASGVGTTVGRRIWFRSTYANGSDSLVNDRAITVALPTIDTNGQVTAASVTGNVEGTIGNLAALASQTVATAIWDEPKASHTTAGTFGYNLDAQVSAAGGGGGSCDSAEIADAVLDELLSGHTTTGSLSAVLSGIYTRLGSTTVTIASPVASSGAIAITQGISYDDGSLTASTAAPSTDLSGATWTFRADLVTAYNSTASAGSAVVTVTCTASLVSGRWVVSVPLTSTITAAMSGTPTTTPNYTYAITAVKSGRTYLHSSGTLLVRKRVG